MKKLKKTFKKHQHIIINSLLAGILIGFLLFAIIRFFTFSTPEHTHYHANWSVYINGQQQKFEDSSFYQEVASCTNDEQHNALHRTHMHDEVYDVVHVHADGVTWGQFFENINIIADTTYLRIHNNIYQNNGSKVTYILNGEKVGSLNSKLIGSEDKLLISYGAENEEGIMQRYNQIQNKAAEFNHMPDPASCSGDSETTIEDRFSNIFK